MQKRRGKRTEPVNREAEPALQPVWPRWATVLTFLGITIFVLIADLITKHLAFARIPDGGISVIPGCLSLTLSQNRGAVFGMGQGMGALFIGFTIIAAIGILWAAWAHGPRSKLLTIGLALLLGGALGNLYDRVVLLHVRDFIDAYLGTHHWPTFNVADIGICSGAGAIVLHAILNPDSARKQEPR